MREPVKLVVVTEGELRELIRESVTEAVRAALGERDKPPSEWMNLEQAAKHLDRSPTYLQQLARRGAVPSHRLGRSYRFSRTELNAFLEASGRS